MLSSVPSLEKVFVPLKSLSSDLPTTDDADALDLPCPWISDIERVPASYCIFVGVEQREQAMEEECWVYEHLISILDQSLLSCSSDCLINSSEYCLDGNARKI